MSLSGPLSFAFLYLCVQALTSLASTEEHGPHCQFSSPVGSGQGSHIWTWRLMAVAGKMLGLPLPLSVNTGCSVVESGSLAFPLPAGLYS